MEKIINVTCKGATEVEIDELNDLQGNLKDLTKENYGKLRDSILQYGFSFPIFMWEEVVNVDTNAIESLANDVEMKATMKTKRWIVDAHQRMRVLKKMREEGYTIPKLPADFIFADSKIEAKEKLLLLNSQYGKMTNEGLYEFINDPIAPIDLSRIEPLLVLPRAIDLEYGRDTQEDEAPGVSADPPISILGEVYKLGRHRLMCGDSTKIEDVLKLTNGQKMDMVFTDPPYNVEYLDLNHNMRDGAKDWTNYTDWGDKMTDDKYYQFVADFLKNLKEVLITNGHYYIWYPSSYHSLFTKALYDNGIHYDKVPIIWQKNTVPISWAHYHRKYEPLLFAGENLTTGDQARWFGPTNEENVWEVDTDHNSTYVHPTQKPVALAARAIKNSSKDNENVIDVFGGSDSTMLACEQLTRNSFTMELDPVYCDVIRKRYAKFIGKESEWQTETPKIQ